MLPARVSAIAKVIDGVVAAPEDPVIGCPAVIVELIAGISHALGLSPADGAELSSRERFGDEHMVVDREHPGPQAPEQWRVGIRREENPSSGDGSLIGTSNNSRFAGLEPCDW